MFYTKLRFNIFMIPALVSSDTISYVIFVRMVRILANINSNFQEGQKYFLFCPSRKLFCNLPPPPIKMKSTPDEKILDAPLARIKIYTFIFQQLVSKNSTFQVIQKLIHQKGMYLNHDFYVVVGKQCCTQKILHLSPKRYLYIN